MPDRWQPGERVTLRYVGHSHGSEAGKPGLLQGWPYLVVEDSHDWLALWMPVGTRMKRLDLADRTRPVTDLIHGQHPTPFRRGEQLRLMRPDTHSSIWLHWNSSTSPLPDARTQHARGTRQDAFLGWYVNIEAAYIRTPIGVDTTDLNLDVVVRPDLSWEWKDEAQHARFEALGVFTPDETRRIRAEGERVIADIDARRPPFDGAWLDWSPPTQWAPPEVHEGWDTHPDVAFPLFTRRRLTGVDPAFEARP